TIIDPAPERDRIQKHNDAIDARLKGDLARIAEILEPARKAVAEKKKSKVSDADAAATLDDELRNELSWRQQIVDEAQKGRLEFTRGMTVRESGSAPATHLFYQGDFTQPREEIAPGFISVLDPNPAAIAGGRRSTLAAWIASPENPLTNRVMVNRLWH